MQEGEFSHLNPAMLGDVVISADTAAREAEEGGIQVYERIVFLMLHGILHLTGYDHERSGEKEAARMEAKESEIMAILRAEGFLG
jgi:probable rRNA maturation factor